MIKSTVLHTGRQWRWREDKPCCEPPQESHLSLLLLRNRYKELTTTTPSSELSLNTKRYNGLQMYSSTHIHHFDPEVSRTNTIVVVVVKQTFLNLIESLHLYNPPPTGDLPLSEDSDVSKPIRGFEGTAASAAVLDDVNLGVHRSCPSLQHSCTFTSFRPTIISIATSSDSQETREGDKAGPLSLQEAPSGTNKEPHTWSHTFTCPSRDTQGQLKVV